MGSQIQNPFDSGAGYFGNALNQFNRIDLGGSVADLGRTINAGSLSDLMAQNGGLANQSMNPLAMLATPEAQKAFQSDLALQRTDIGLDQQDVQLGISQQNANTSAYSANTGRLNYNLNKDKWNTSLLGAQQVGDALAGAFDPARFQKRVMQIESGGTKDPWTATNPNSSAFGAFQITKPTLMAKAKQMNMSEDVARTPFGQQQIMDALTKEYTNTLKHYGLPVNDTTMLAMHQWGAPTVLRAAQGKLTPKDIATIGHTAAFKQTGGRLTDMPSAMSGVTLPKNGKFTPAMAQLMMDAYNKDTSLKQELFKDDYTTGNDVALAKFKEDYKQKVKYNDPAKILDSKVGAFNLINELDQQLVNASTMYDINPTPALKNQIASLQKQKSEIQKLIETTNRAVISQTSQGSSPLAQLAPTPGTPEAAASASVQKLVETAKPEVKVDSNKGKADTQDGLKSIRDAGTNINGKSIQWQNGRKTGLQDGIEVFDADSGVYTKNGISYPFRLGGVDAPETKHTFPDTPGGRERKAAHEARLRKQAKAKNFALNEVEPKGAEALKKLFLRSYGVEPNEQTMDFDINALKGKRGGIKLGDKFTISKPADIGKHGRNIVLGKLGDKEITASNFPEYIKTGDISASAVSSNLTRLTDKNQVASISTALAAKDPEELTDLVFNGTPNKVMKEVIKKNPAVKAKTKNNLSLALSTYKKNQNPYLKDMLKKSISNAVEYGIINDTTANKYRDMLKPVSFTDEKIKIVQEATAIDGKDNIDSDWWKDNYTGDMINIVDMLDRDYPDVNLEVPGEYFNSQNFFARPDVIEAAQAAWKDAGLDGSFDRKRMVEIYNRDQPEGIFGIRSDQETKEGSDFYRFYHALGRRLKQRKKD